MNSRRKATVALISGLIFSLLSYYSMNKFNSLDSYLPKIIAHRGASFYAPENTLAAFNLAYIMGCKWIELDCHLNADNEPVVIHDDSFNRTTNGKGKVAQSLSKYLQVLDAGSWFHPKYQLEHIPLLKEVLLFAKKMDMSIYIELKGDNIQLAHNTLQLIEATNMSSKVVIQSFSFDLLQAGFKINPHLIYEFLIDDEPKPYHFEQARSIHARAINVNGEHISNEGIQKIQSEGFEVNTYTINSSKRMLELMNLGINGIITDRPDLALEEKTHYYLNYKPRLSS